MSAFLGFGRVYVMNTYAVHTTTGFGQSLNFSNFRIFQFGVAMCQIPSNGPGKCSYDVVHKVWVISSPKSLAVWTLGMRLGLSCCNKKFNGPYLRIRYVDPWQHFRFYWWVSPNLPISLLSFCSLQVGLKPVLLYNPKVEDRVRQVYLKSWYWAFEW